MAEGRILVSYIECVTGNKIGVVTLDNPNSLNALNYDMLLAIKAQLQQWERDPAVVCIFIDSVDDNAFCAGGDIREMYRAMADHSDDVTQQLFTQYFTAEYSCDYEINSCSKPVIAWGHGLVMGGGMGIYMAADYRIVTENSQLAMPEVRIGLYPDVGATYFLSQLPSGIGLFLGLTGCRVNASDALFLGMANAFIRKEQKEQFIEALQQISWRSNVAPEAQNENRQHIESQLSILSEENAAFYPASQMVPYLPQIQAACHHGDLNIVAEQILAIDGLGQWLEEAKQGLRDGSPISAHICFRQLTQYNHISLAESYRLDLGLSIRCGLLGEFQEGVRAKLIDKDQCPNWRYKSLKEVDSSLIDTLFEPLWLADDHPFSSFK